MKAAAVVVSLVMACASSRSFGALKADRQPAPTFTLKDVKGNTINLSTHKGSVVLLDFWGTFCDLCKTEMPWFMEFQKTYRPRGLSVIGVATDNDPGKVKSYLAKVPVSYSIAVGDGNVEKTYQIKSLPVTLLIDREGRIAAVHDGIVDKASMETEIRSLLDEPSKMKH